MYYLIKTEEGIKVSSPTEASHREMKDLGFEVVGNFGRLDYATHWAEYKNGLISEWTHRQWLGLRILTKEEESCL